MPQFKEDELNEILSNEFNIFGVISHVAPTFAFPEIVYDNAFTQKNNMIEKADMIKNRTPIELFDTFYELQNNKKLDELKSDAVKEIFRELGGCEE